MTDIVLSQSLPPLENLDLSHCIVEESAQKIVFILPIELMPDTSREHFERYLSDRFTRLDVEQQPQWGRKCRATLYKKHP